MKVIDFNINKNVLVKFTEAGFMEMARQQNEALKDWKGYEEVNVGTFETRCVEGYYSMQMWMLLRFFQDMEEGVNMHQTPNLMATDIKLVIKE